MASAAPSLRVTGMRFGARLKRDAAIYFPAFAPPAAHSLSLPPDFSELDAEEFSLRASREVGPITGGALLKSLAVHVIACGALVAVLTQADIPAAAPPPITGMNVMLVDQPPAAAARTHAPRDQVGANAHAAAGAVVPAALADFEIPSKAIAAGVPVVSPQAALPPAVADTNARDASADAAPSRGDKTVMPAGTPDPRSLDEERWEGAILTLLEHQKRYPGSALRRGAEDTVLLRITLDRQGALLLAEIVRSRGIAPLDREAMALAKRAAPYPMPPSSVLGDAVRLVVPIEFVMKRDR